MPVAPQFALIDINNAFCSFERVFNPKLEGKPLIVLTNNDGLAISRSSEAKAIGVKMGTPLFELKGLTKRHGLIALSPNYSLYADMSNRFCSILKGFSPEFEQYSIDETFLRIESVSHLYGGSTLMGEKIVKRMQQWIGLPVCVGIGPTKTLAKLANHLAKKNESFGRVCNLHDLTRADRLRWMHSVDVGEVWSVGHRIGKRLAGMGIETVLDLRNANPKEIRKQFSVVLERTCQELRGVSCLELEDMIEPKKQIMSSRGFGASVYELDELCEAVAFHTAIAAEKLRLQESVAAGIHVFIMGRRAKGEQLESFSETIALPQASDDTRKLTRAALAGLKKIFRPGMEYKKAGVMFLFLAHKKIRSMSLFDDPRQDEKSERLMRVMDGINNKYGRRTVQTAACGVAHRWAMRSEFRTPRYTSRWDELPVVG